MYICSKICFLFDILYFGWQIKIVNMDCSKDCNLRAANTVGRIMTKMSCSMDCNCCWYDTSQNVLKYLNPFQLFLNIHLSFNFYLIHSISFCDFWKMNSTPKRQKQSDLTPGQRDYIIKLSKEFSIIRTTYCDSRFIYVWNKVYFQFFDPPLFSLKLFFEKISKPIHVIYHFVQY